MPQNTGKNQSAALWIILAVVVLAAAALFMYFGDYGSDKETNSNSSTIVNTNSEVNTNTQNTNTVGNTNSTTNTNESINTNVNTMTSNDEIYEGDGFSFQPPKNLYVNEEEDLIQFAAVPENPLGAYKNTFVIVRNNIQEPAMVDGEYIILDSKPVSSRSIDNYEANVYKFENGYEGTPAFIIYLVKVNEKFYRFDFWNTSEETTQIKNVVNSITFNN